MKLINYSLKVKKELLTDVTIEFGNGKINHLLGQNGTGKSCLVKSLLGRFRYKGRVEMDADRITVIGSYSNIPAELTVKNIHDMAKKYNNEESTNCLYRKLRIDQIPMNVKYKNLSDGQKQKMKLLFFLADSPDLVILDEFTNALDKETCMEVYEFMNRYIFENRSCTILNITHNLSDLENMDGSYYFMNDGKIEKVPEKEEIINRYIKGI